MATYGARSAALRRLSWIARSDGEIQAYRKGTQRQDMACFGLIEVAISTIQSLAGLPREGSSRQLA